MAELNFGLLNPPGSQSIGNAFVQGMDQAAAARAQENQNALSQYTLGKARREDELSTQLLGELRKATTPEEIYRAYQRVGKPEIASKMQSEALTQEELRGKIRAQPGLMARTAEQTNADKAKTARENATYAYETISRLAALPGGATDQDITAAISDAGGRGLLPMQEATRVQKALLDATPEQRREYLLMMGADAAKRLQALTPDIRQVTTPTGGVDFRNFAPFSQGFGQTPTGFTNLAPGMTQYQTGRLNQDAAGLAIRNREIDPYGMFSPITVGGAPTVNAPPAQVSGVAPVAPVAAPAGAAPKMTLADAFKNNVTGPEFIALIPPQVKPVVESILRYDQRPPNTATKQGLRLLELVNQADPTYDAGKAQSRYVAKQTFVKGPVADAIASTNTAIDHMDTLAKYGADLNNTDVRLANMAKQGLAAAFGADAPTTFDATRKIVGQEVVKAVVANGGSMREREEAADAFNRANSPAQLAGVIKSYQALLGGRLKSTQLRYENDTGLKDFQTKLLPATIRALSGEAATPAPALTPADLNRQALDWAAANPNDPRAARIRQKNGVK